VASGTNNDEFYEFNDEFNDEFYDEFYYETYDDEFYDQSYDFLLLICFIFYFPINYQLGVDVTNVSIFLLLFAN